MGTLGIIIVDILIAVIGFFSSYGFFSILNFFSFTVPFSNLLTSLDVIEPTVKKQLLIVDIASSLVTFLLPMGLCVMGACFTQPSGFIVLGIVVFLALIVFPPSRDRYTYSEYNIKQYVLRHAVCIDCEKFARYKDGFLTANVTPFYDTNNAAIKLIDTIIHTSNTLTSPQGLFPYGCVNKNLECSLVAMSCFLVSGLASDDNLAYELIPVYQKKIMPTVDKTEYDRRTQAIQRYFSEYRENAIKIQESQQNYFMPMVEKFAELTATNIGVSASPEQLSTLCNYILELIRTINPKLGI